MTNQQNTKVYPQWNQVNGVSGSKVAGDTLQLTASQNGWCVVEGFKYWNTTGVWVNNTILFMEQNVGDDDAKTSFMHAFPVKANDIIKIVYPANPQQRRYAIRLYA